MRISGDVPKIIGIYDKVKNHGQAGGVGAVTPKADVVSISSTAKDYQTAMKSLKDVPDVRSGKVDEIASRYQSGNYNVSGADIADSILKAAFDRRV